MSGLAGSLTPGPGRDAAWPAAAQKGRWAGSFALTTKPALLERSHFGFEHVHLGLEFLGPGHRAPVLATLVMGLLTQGDDFGLQPPRLLSERGRFRSERPWLALARWRGGPQAWGLTRAAYRRRVPRKMRLKPLFSSDAFTECLPDHARSREITKTRCGDALQGRTIPQST